MESSGRCPRGLERFSAHDEPLTLLVSVDTTTPATSAGRHRFDTQASAACDPWWRLTHFMAAHFMRTVISAYRFVISRLTSGMLRTGLWTPKAVDRTSSAYIWADMAGFVANILNTKRSGMAACAAQAWGRMVPSSRERRGGRNVGPLFPGCGDDHSDCWSGFP